MYYKTRIVALLIFLYVFALLILLYIIENLVFFRNHFFLSVSVTTLGFFHFGPKIRNIRTRCLHSLHRFHCRRWCRSSLLGLLRRLHRFHCRRCCRAFLGLLRRLHCFHGWGCWHVEERKGSNLRNC